MYDVMQDLEALTPTLRAIQYNSQIKARYKLDVTVEVNPRHHVRFLLGRQVRQFNRELILREAVEANHANN